MLFVFVFNPKWDMHWLRAKEIKDSLNSQAVPKILVLLKMALPGSTLAQVPLFLQYSIAWLVSPGWLYQMLWDPNVDVPYVDAQGHIMVHRNIPWYKIIVPWWYKDVPWDGYNVLWYTIMYHGIF